MVFLCLQQNYSWLWCFIVCLILSWIRVEAFCSILWYTKSVDFSSLYTSLYLIFLSRFHLLAASINQKSNERRNMPCIAIHNIFKFNTFLELYQSLSAIIVKTSSKDVGSFFFRNKYLIIIRKQTDNFSLYNCAQIVTIQSEFLSCKIAILLQNPLHFGFFLMVEISTD